jgi:hypothetical protein
VIRLSFDPPPRPRPRDPGSTSLFSPLHFASMHFDAHQPIINDLEARILTIRDSL